ncbi:MAG TPA: plastocyanin/azurin family copper-binding protein [Candidatus Limnocylindria bacterium]|nr:plastocyanin/azurin family copper-binding protein [Candidatus Limnocylindria bacterium]
MISSVRRVARVLVAAFAAFSLLAAGVSLTQASPQSRTWTVLVGAQSRSQAIQGMAYLPANVYIHPGDTVRWLANAAEPHTVTFLADGQAAPEFNPGDLSQLFPSGTDTYDGSSYYNSGILATSDGSGLPVRDSYSLTFPEAGTFSYLCLVHGVVQTGWVHVIPADQPYPFTQSQYDAQAQASIRAMVTDGNRLRSQALQTADSHTVIMGADDGVAMLMEFVRPTVVVHTGESVTFRNDGMGAPHTVTFGNEPANPFAPLGDPTSYTGGDLNSGIVPPGGSFTVTFDKAGTFPYICALHDYMGMVGRVIVQP